jgi:hypothetical protein
MKVTVIAAGFDKRRPNKGSGGLTRPSSLGSSRSSSDDDLDIPNFVQG